MGPRVTDVFLLIDFIIGTFFLAAAAMFIAAVFVVTGAPKGYEQRALGAAYSDFLLRIEDGARWLQSDFCAQADAETAEQARCEALSETGLRPSSGNRS